MRWLSEQEINSISEADADVLINYRKHVAELTISPKSKDTRMLGLWRMWRYAPYLPARDRLMQPPWEDAGYEDEVSGWDSPQQSRSENRTRPIHPETMSALLVWSMRFVDDFSSDILRARQRRADMDANIRQRRRDGDLERWNHYLDGLRRTCEPLPGHTLNNGNTGLAMNYLAATLGISLSTIRNYQPSDIPLRVGAPVDVEIRGQIDRKQWVEAIDYYEVDSWVRRLATACAVVTAYLSGLRPEECLALKRGCCQLSDPTDDLSGYEIRGLTFKKRGRDGNTIRGGVERRNPWYVIEPVARAVKVMERLHPHELLFPVAAFGINAARSASRSANTESVNRNIQALIEWCNESAGREPLIPSDSNGPVTTRKFRRTVAWFIYRLPRGLIALGSQYGHINLLQSEGYGRRSWSGMSDVLEEHAFVLRDRLEDGHEQLAAGEGVSGPAAERFVGSVKEYKERFRGSVLTPREAKVLLKNPNLHVLRQPRATPRLLLRRIPGPLPPQQRSTAPHRAKPRPAQVRPKMRQYRPHRLPHGRARRGSQIPGSTDRLADNTCTHAGETGTAARPVAHRESPTRAETPRHGTEGAMNPNIEEPERRLIRDAMTRLLDGDPIRSDGKLTMKSLAAEAGLKRWYLTHKHTDLRDEFYDRVRVQGTTHPPP